jgi:hypothetical protein
MPGAATGLFEWALGPAGMQLGTGPAGWPARLGPGSHGPSCGPAGSRPCRRDAPARARFGGERGQRGLSPIRFVHLHIRMPRAVAQRPAGDRADMLLELVDGAARLGPVAGIVHARGDLVHDRAPRGRHEELHPDHAHIIERVQDAPSASTASVPEPAGIGRARWWSRRMPSSWTFSPGIVAGDRPVHARARRSPDLAGEGDEPLGDGGRAVQGGERGFGIFRARHAGLPLAVIAEAAGLQDRGRAGWASAAARSPGPSPAKGRRLQPEFRQESVFRQAVLAHLQRARSPGRAGRADSTSSASAGMFSNS